MYNYSVVMTVYAGDDPEHFDLALKSMVMQSYAPSEIVLVKDGPIGEELQQVIDGFADKDVPIVQVQLVKNVGLGLALNEGIKAAKNELIARMDADDYSLPERCELQVKEFEKNSSLDIVGCQVLEFSEQVENIVGERRVPLTNDDIYRFAKRRDPFNHPTVMYRKTAVINAGYYADYRKNQDTDLWIRMLANGAVCMNLAEAPFRFRFDNGTYKKRKSWLNTKILIEIRYRAWRSGFCSFTDFLLVSSAQICMFLLPTGFQALLYKAILRR